MALQDKDLQVWHVAEDVIKEMDVQPRAGEDVSVDRRTVRYFKVGKNASLKRSCLSFSCNPYTYFLKCLKMIWFQFHLDRILLWCSMDERPVTDRRSEALRMATWHVDRLVSIGNPHPFPPQYTHVYHVDECVSVDSRGLCYGLVSLS